MKYRTNISNLPTDIKDRMEQAGITLLSERKQKRAEAEFNSLEEANYWGTLNFQLQLIYTKAYNEIRKRELAQSNT